MGHAAVTSADSHRYGETFSRGGIGQASVEAKPFRAWIDDWEMRGIDGMSDATIAPLELKASGTDFSYALRLAADRPLVLQGDAGYSRKSERGQASYYFSQPYFNASGIITIDDKPVQVTGSAWMDREWSSQPLASDQTGWDWFSLHLGSSEKLMLFRLRQADGQHYFSGNWIGADGKSTQIASADIHMTPMASTEIESRKVPTQWTIAIPSRGLQIESTPLNARSWMATSFRLLGRPDQFSRKPQRRWLSGDDGVLRLNPSLPGLTRQPLYLEKLLRRVMIRGSSPRITPQIGPDPAVQRLEALHRVRDTRSYFVSGQPLSAAVGNALSPGTIASCL